MAFEDPQVALAVLSAVRPDILLSDVIMPRMTGIELAIHVRQTQPKCKVLLLSGDFATTDCSKRRIVKDMISIFSRSLFPPEELLAKLHALV
jgi:CheY-like chemotaxis protein